MAARTTSSATYVFVAATDSSGPARQSITNSAAPASGDVAAFVTATVTAPPARAASVTATTSGLSPDCETATRRPPCQSSGG